MWIKREKLQSAIQMVSIRIAVAINFEWALCAPE